ncbi:dTDP-4-dehydrorhamnose reductase [uncultured Croceitalea sp.]|uniref:dTDP-4-dehydrorhamnose reductase n=1 Tax=uncultured Croceitalea sp. TaxID=1798908 RepID=UPI003305D445
MKNILVTGGNGQLATCIRNISSNVEECNFIFVDVDELDIAKKTDVKIFFKKNNITHCINCAAYTAVDRAESDQNLAKRINITGAKNLAEECKNNAATLIHISTDFVFDGKKNSHYNEKDKEAPLGVYGETKLLGEKEIVSILKEHFIIRTSWLYSEYGHNFLKTMLKLGEEKKIISVVVDQIGTPTYAGDLAKVIVDLIMSGSSSYGTYHYSNEGVSSWYDFAKAIFDEARIKVNVVPIKTEAFPTPAERPRFSVMDKSKIKKKLSLPIPYWRDSLAICLTKLQKVNNDS